MFQTKEQSKLEDYEFFSLWCVQLRKLKLIYATGLLIAYFVNVMSLIFIRKDFEYEYINLLQYIPDLITFMTLLKMDHKNYKVLNLISVLDIVTNTGKIYAF